MFIYKLSLLLGEGFIFGILAMGVYISFQWLRFPDLTPDGSFVAGACGYSLLTLWGISPIVAICITFIFGASIGCVTAALNRFIKVPSIVAGLLVSAAMYSLNWLLLGKPNQFLDPKFTLIGNVVGLTWAIYLLLWLTFIGIVLVLFLVIFSNTLWGLRLRAIGENSLLAHDLHVSETGYIFGGLALSNGIVALAGALFSQRSFSVDINMGIGVTITGLAGMVLGLLIVQGRRNMVLVCLSVLLGALLHKAVIFICLEAGVPGETFRLLTAFTLILVFFFAKASTAQILRGLRWT